MTLREPVVTIRWTAGIPDEIRLWIGEQQVCEYIIREAVDSNNANLESNGFGGYYYGEYLTAMSLRDALGYWRYMHEVDDEYEALHVYRFSHLTEGARRIT